MRHALQALAVGALAAPTRWLPRPACRRLGRALGHLLWLASGKLRRQSLWNLEHAFPELPREERLAIARRNLPALGAEFFDVAWALRLAPEALLDLFQIEGREHLESAAARGGGIMVMGAHLGCFELAAWWAGTAVGPLHAVSKRLANPYFDRRLWDVRSRHGIRTIEEAGAGRRIYKLLEAGEKVLIALDQRTRYEDAIAVSFFGRVSLTSPVPAFIAQRLGTPVVPAFARATAAGYALRFQAPIAPFGEGPRAVAELTERYLAVLEEEIRRRPEQWIWPYRRWRPEWDDPARVGSSLADRERPLPGWSPASPPA